MNMLLSRHSKRMMTVVVIIFLFQLSGCDTAPHDQANPPAPGFNLAGSDARAIAIADEVMQALGGRRAWDKTRYITWRFFGRRQHIWDKWSGNLRYTYRNLLVLMNLSTNEGRAWLAGREVTRPEISRSRHNCCRRGRRCSRTDIYRSRRHAGK